MSGGVEEALGKRTKLRNDRTSRSGRDVSVESSREDQGYFLKEKLRVVRVYTTVAM